ncbi:(deoxy)nucleoside triphosphate pyrophosphohydrolase [Clostridiaceae bacterium UIB06]|uniref:(Deoxy)nucleoside triphosphate pyrophosphohydrolase n=1 Tax=Clostridium thailandense TaxID=2794346 RepID=A0A949TY72_9CLOT|nr:(deoxy)nucleoside triphosphate pyrophosphohydrolase [Clostridium thailandense]MBV7273760.1 (deoxy)nucleoside triphosphate pyrophosphohydrolase [Clostridium thailandense]MCH5137460.1 (deoxy)nucleoside triphosphate pyrophosphohydrolase [Clostridiaceae bacterium UIB06]
MKKLIKVVGAVIENENNEILCALRSPKMSLPNIWEFPGGKVEKDENLKEAIEREIKEELGCNVEYSGVFNDNTHEYDTFIVNLITVKCKLVSGKPTANEHSKLIWLKRENLLSLKWAPADVPAVMQLTEEKI